MIRLYARRSRFIPPEKMIPLRDSLDELPRVRMLRIRVYLLGIAGLYQHTPLHNRNPAAELSYYFQIVGDEEH